MSAHGELVEARCVERRRGRSVNKEMVASRSYLRG
jgi:hypothetical protein